MNFRLPIAKAGSNAPRPIADAVRRYNIAALTSYGDQLAAQLEATPDGAALLAAVNKAHGPVPSNWSKGHARIAALESAAAKTPAPPRAAPAPSQTTKPAPPATPRPVAASPVISTEKLEQLALHVFGSDTLPKMGGMSDTAKREALTRELWQAHLKVDGAEVSAADAHAKHWRRAEKLTGAFATIAAWRQNRANAFLNLPAADNRPRMPRAAFNKMSPRAQSDFCRGGGRITD